MAIFYLQVSNRAHDELYQTWRYEAMCDSCASRGLYATAGRHCSQCDVSLCDTCAFTHSDGFDRQAHTIITLSSKCGAHKTSQSYDWYWRNRSGYFQEFTPNIGLCIWLLSLSYYAVIILYYIIENITLISVLSLLHFKDFTGINHRLNFSICGTKNGV